MTVWYQSLGIFGNGERIAAMNSENPGQSSGISTSA
jgi:hypothetical protein